MDIRLGVVFHKNQTKVHNGLTRFTVIKAGKRFGKTYWALAELSKAALGKHNGVFWLIAPTYRQAKSIAWHTLKWILPKEVIRRSREDELMIELINGSRIELKGADNEDSLRGAGIDGVIFDEVAYIDEYLWTAIIRGQLAGSKGFAYFISSPKKTGTNWFTSFCDEAKRKMANGDPEWSFFYFTIYDNPTLAVEEIEKIRESVPDYVWNLEYMGIESDLAGNKYSEFTVDRNVGVRSGQGVFPVFRFLDWGLDHPTVCLWAELDEKNKVVYIFDEYVKSNLTISENCAAIKEKTGGRPVEWNVIDPSASRRDPISKRSLLDEFSRWGLTCIPGDRRERGADIVKMFLKKGMAKISPKCKTLIYELQNLQWGDKEGDDATDALRYGLVRIHDFVHGMNIFDLEASNFKPSANRNELNFNDPRLFPQKESGGGLDWLMEECNAA